MAQHQVTLSQNNQSSPTGGILQKRRQSGLIIWVYLVDHLQRVDLLALMWHVCYSEFDLCLAVALPSLSHSSWEQLIIRPVHRWVWHEALWKSPSHQHKWALETEQEWCSVHITQEFRLSLEKMVSRGHKREITKRVRWWLLYTGLYSVNILLWKLECANVKSYLGALAPGTQFWIGTVLNL